MPETWKEIAGFPGYFVSDSGKIGSSKRSKTEGRGQIMKTSLAADGYVQTNLRRDGKYVTVEVHQEVAKAFIENPHNWSTVKHIDENRSNNQVSNLQWAPRIGPGGRDGKPIILIDTGEEFESVRAYVNLHGGHPDSIYKVIRGVRRTFRGKRFKWKEETLSG